MSHVIVERALGLYGIKSEKILSGQKGYRNTSYPIVLQNGRLVNLILYKRESGILARIKRVNYIGNLLGETVLPVRQPIDHRIVKLQGESTLGYGALYNYLPGETIPWEAYGKNHIKLMGMGMGRMHGYLCEVAFEAPSVVEEYEKILDRMEVYFSRHEVKKAMQEKLGLVLNHSLFFRFRNILAISRVLPGQQLLHMDFVRSNILFKKTAPSDQFFINDVALSGIIDFEKLAYGHPLFDIARTLAFLYVDCKTKAPEKIRKNFLVSGYIKRGGMKFSEGVISSRGRKVVLLDELLCLFWLHDFYKFLLHNPYESLGANKHFLQTQHILNEQKMVCYIQK